MIKAIIGTTEHPDGTRGPLLILGLSAKNLRNLVDVGPILFDLGDSGYRLAPDRESMLAGGRPVGHKVLIVTGETEQGIAAALGLPGVGEVGPGEERRIFHER